MLGLFHLICNKIIIPIFLTHCMAQEEVHKRSNLLVSHQLTRPSVSISDKTVSADAFEISSSNTRERKCCEVYAFSNALMTSVKLAHWEHSLDALILSIESLPRALIKGIYSRSYSPNLVLSKIGEILTIRWDYIYGHNLFQFQFVFFLDLVIAVCALCK